MSVLIKTHRARLTVAAVVGAYFCLLEWVGGHNSWSRLGVPALRNADFFDLRSVTSAWDCTRYGVAVLPLNPCDPVQRSANYPRLWLVPSSFGLGQGDTFWLGIVIAVLFLIAAVMVIPAGASVKLGLGYAAVLCSPAVMLGVERGNVDILLFVFVLVGVLLTRRGVRGLLAGDALLFLSAILKLFPIFAIGFLLRRARRAAVVSVAAISAGFVIDVIVTRNYIRLIFNSNFEEDYDSFGVRRVAEWTRAVSREAFGSQLVSRRVWDYALVLFAVVVACLLTRGLRSAVRRVDVAPSDERDLDLFWAGALVYIGSYATQRNFDYRLVFLLLTVPQLLRWARAGYLTASVTIAALLGTTWLDVWGSMPVAGSVASRWNELTALGPKSQELPFAVVCQFVLFGGLVAWVVATAPFREWVKAAQSRRSA